ILLEANKTGIYLTATDLEIAVTAKIDGEVVEEGSLTVPARKFSEIIKELPSQNPIYISIKKGQAINIESGKSFIRLQGLLKDDFPQIPDLAQNKGSESVKISQKTLKKMIQMTSFSMSHDETRYVLNGILFGFKDKALRLVATDGRRLAVMDEQVPDSSNLKKEVIVPAKTIQELNRNLADDGDAVFYFKENQLQISLGQTNISSRLIEGEYPNYEQVIPKKIKESVELNTEDFLQATRRASILTNPESQGIKISFVKDRLIITKASPEFGEVREEIEADYKGAEVLIGFNPSFLIDMLKNVEKETVQFGFSDPEKPALIKSGDNYTYIVLPMQTA
ncbi:MAG: DNA polymerase III subunit beta, partial [Candidatus Omnitrophota bacterium]